MTTENSCPIINSKEKFNAFLKEKDKVFILFYASWCPYSQKFLPAFVRSSKECVICHMRILSDDQQELFDEYNIGVYPTVIFFANGKVLRRLDGVYHQGLNTGQLKTFIKECGY